MIIAGAVLVGLGLVLNYAPWLVNWFGRLPGDIRVENGSSRVYIPLVSMLLTSVVLSVILNLMRRFF
jgi:hypothetical protein